MASQADQQRLRELLAEGEPTPILAMLEGVIKGVTRRYIDVQDEEFDDCCQELRIAVLRLISKYDPTKHCEPFFWFFGKLRSYAGYFKCAKYRRFGSGTKRSVGIGQLGVAANGRTYDVQDHRGWDVDLAIDMKDDINCIMQAIEKEPGRPRLKGGPRHKARVHGDLRKKIIAIARSADDIGVYTILRMLDGECTATDINKVLSDIGHSGRHIPGRRKKPRLCGELRERIKKLVQLNPGIGYKAIWKQLGGQCSARDVEKVLADLGHKGQRGGVKKTIRSVA